MLLYFLFFIFFLSVTAIWLKLCGLMLLETVAVWCWNWGMSAILMVLCCWDSFKGAVNNKELSCKGAVQMNVEAWGLYWSYV